MDSRPPGFEPTTARLKGAQEQELAQACMALWVATLSLMTAFMHNQAPAHRYLLARRISNNLATLQQQECFSRESQATFGKLCRRWNGTADQLGQQQSLPRRGGGLLHRWWPQR
jgi:hypothetical protein